MAHYRAYSNYTYVFGLRLNHIILLGTTYLFDLEARNVDQTDVNIVKKLYKKGEFPKDIDYAMLYTWHTLTILWNSDAG